MNIFHKLGDGIDAFRGGRKSASKSFSFDNPPDYLRDSAGNHTYSFGTTSFGLLGALGLGTKYYKPLQNTKAYYIDVPYLADCINLYADFASQVIIYEVDKSGKIIDDSDFLSLLKKPNQLQDQQSFIKEMAINTLTTGISVQYGSYFRNGNLRSNAELYNLDFCNLAMPKLKNRYIARDRDIQDLEVVETLEDGEKRRYKLYELAVFYDLINQGQFGKDGFKADEFFNPISRLFSIQRSLHTLINTEDAINFLSSNKMYGILSRKNSTGAIVPLGDDEKRDIEAKLRKHYGFIATNEDLQYLNLLVDSKKLQLVEYQNNAKENIRSAFQIPRDIQDSTSGDTKGSTYENQQFAESRFINGNVKGITDRWLKVLMTKSPEYFAKTGTTLVGSYEEMPSQVAVNGKLKNDGLKAQSEALKAFFDAYTVAKNNGLQMNAQEFLMQNGFEGLTIEMIENEQGTTGSTSEENPSGN